MKLLSLKIKGFKNLDFRDNPIDFSQSEGISIFVGNNGSGKSNVLEAISAIFSGLYDETNERRCNFTYELEYEINGKKILIIQYFFTGKKEAIGIISDEVLSQIPDAKELRFPAYYIDGKYVEDFDRDLLPSQIITLYSGEETRLYESYYYNEYKKFIVDVIYLKKTIQDNINMQFINKEFWSIALLIFAYYDIDYSNILGKFKVSNIHFDVDESKITSFHSTNPNEVTEFVKKLIGTEILSIEEFKSLIDIGVYGIYVDFYKILSIATLSKKESDVMVNKIDLTISDGKSSFLSDALSEGEKKQILLCFVTKILADKDSIILLDEPDSYIHVGNKQKLKNFFEDFLITEKEGEIIITTHSPTLMSKFDRKNLFYLEKGKLDLKDKRGILDKITDGQMLLNEMEIFLNSGNKYLLVTEGITDKKHLEIAIEKLGIENKFDIYSADSCEKLTNFLITLPNDIFSNKTIIGIYDYDQAGLKALNHLGEKIEDNKKYKVSGKANRFGISLPYTDNNFENNPVFTIELMYSKDVLKNNQMIEYRTVDDINKCIKNQDNKLNLAEIKEKDELCFYKVCESENSKNNFTDKVRELDAAEFSNFKPLFDLILSIE